MLDLEEILTRIAAERARLREVLASLGWETFTAEDGTPRWRFPFDELSLTAYPPLPDDAAVAAAVCLTGTYRNAQHSVAIGFTRWGEPPEDWPYLYADWMAAQQRGSIVAREDELALYS